MPGAAVAATGAAGARIRGARRVERKRAAAVHRRGSPQEMPIVRDVPDAVGTLRVDLCDVALVGADRALVGRDRVGVAAGAHVDVRRHVQQVARSRHQPPQPVRARPCLLRMRRRLHQVDPVVVGAGVRRCLRERAREQRADLRGPRACAAILRPPVVRVQVQQRLRGERGDVGVARIGAGEGVHAQRIRLLVDSRGIVGERMPRRQCVDRARDRGGPRVRRVRARGRARLARAPRRPAPCRH